MMSSLPITKSMAKKPAKIRVFLRYCCIFGVVAALIFCLILIKYNVTTLNQTDPQLITYVRRKYLTPPSNRDYQMTETVTKEQPTDLLERMIVRFFKNKTGGTFVEAGAHDGDNLTHTYHLERVLGWRGLLIECNPQVLPALMSKNRKAWISNACISPTDHLSYLNLSSPSTYQIASTLREVKSLPEKLQLKGFVSPSDWKTFRVPSVPLYTQLAALGPDWNDIDYMSLDIEGQELAAMKHFPFDKIIFKVITIEIHALTEEEKEELNRIMSANGYIRDKDVIIDRIFVHNSVKHLLQNDSFFFSST